MKLKTYRQGDVLIQQVARIPSDAVKQKPENGRIILASGEATGHHHALAIEGADLWKTNGGEPFITVTDEAPLRCAVKCRNRKNGLECYVPSEIGVEPYLDLEAIGEEMIRAAELTHQEHLPHLYPAGDYRVTRQREYTPEAIRNVED